MFRRRRARDNNPAIDITPMIDIVFIMLIFFVVTATFIKETGLDLPPSNAPTPRLDRAGILIAIDATNRVRVDGRAADIRAVRANIERLRAGNPGAGVVIQAHVQSENGTLVKVMDAAKLAGASISLADTRRE